MKVGLIRALLTCLTIILLLSFTGCSTWYSDKILDNREHGLPCEALPTPDEVKQVLAEHLDLVQEIEAVNPGHVTVEVDELTCPNRADIVISYPSHQDREKIEAILQSDTFFGAPYRLCNR
jgi:hypothetical protein